MALPSNTTNLHYYKLNIDDKAKIHLDNHLYTCEDVIYLSFFFSENLVKSVLIIRDDERNIAGCFDTC